MSVALPHPFWCTTCGQRPVTHAGDVCPGCLGHLETLLLDPIRHKPTPQRPSWWLRVLRRLGGQA